MKENPSRGAYRRARLGEPLSEIEKDILSKVALGATAKEVGEMVEPPVAEAAIKSQLSKIYTKLGGTKGDAIYEAHRTKQIDLDAIAKDEDISGYELMSPAEANVLEGYLFHMLNERKRSSRRSVARTLFISESTVHTHLRRIFTKTGTRNATHAVVGYLAWKNQQDELGASGDIDS